MAKKKIKAIATPYSDIKDLNCYIKKLLDNCGCNDSGSGGGNGGGGSFDFVTENTPSVELLGNGTVISPLMANGILSQFPGNDLFILPDGFYHANVIDNGVVSGGIVTWLGDYDYHVSAAIYYINGVQYNQTIDNPGGFFFTLAAPDLTFNRLDSFIVDNSGNTGVIQGDPSSNPALVDLDPASQLQLSFALVEVGTTQPTITTECIYRNNNETPLWTGASSTARLDLNSLVTPCNGVKSIEATSALTNDFITITRSSVFAPVVSHTQLTMFIKSKGFSGNPNLIRFQWFNGVTPVGTSVPVRNFAFNFQGLNTSSCQVVTIPLSFFGISGLNFVDQLKISVETQAGGQIGFFIDDICLQGVPQPEVPAPVDIKVKVSANDTTADFLLSKLQSTDLSVLITEINNGGNEKINLAANVTANNGLTKTLANIQLGGLLLHNTDIDTDNYYLYLHGLDDDNGGGILRVENTGAGFYGNGIFSRTNATVGLGVAGISINYGGVFGSGPAFGLQGRSTSGYGVSGVSDDYLGGSFISNPTSTATVVPVIEIMRTTQGTAANNMGGSMDYKLQAADGFPYISNKTITKWTNATTKTSAFSITGLDTNVEKILLTLAGTGQATLNQYTGAVATFTGTPTFNLSVDTNGNIIQTALASALAANNGLSVVSSVVKLGGNPLLANSTISTSAFSLTIDSSHATNTLSITNSGATGYAFKAVNSGGGPAGFFDSSNGSFTLGANNSSANGIGVYGVGTSTGVGVRGEGQNGVVGYSSTAYGGGFVIELASTNTYAGAVFLERRVSGGAGAAGVGTGIDFRSEMTNSSTQIIGKFKCVTTNAVVATRTTDYIFTNLNNGAETDRFKIEGATGYLQAGGYGAGTITGGAATFGLAVDNTGKIIEIALGGAGFTNPMTTPGDIIVGGAAGTPTRLAMGTANQVLAVNGAGTALIYTTLAGAGTVTSVDLSGSDFTFTGNPVTTTGTIAITLATVNADVGSFGSSTSIPSFTVNGKGLITAASGNVVIAPAGTLTGATLNATVTASSLTSVGTLTGGTWNATAIAAIHGGTGFTTYTAGDIIYSSALNTLSKLAATTNGFVLTLVAGLPTWSAVSGTGTVTSVQLSGGSTGLSYTGTNPITTSGTITLTGTLLVASGGTGRTTLSQGSLVYGTGSTAYAELVKSATATRYLSNQGPTNDPSWSQVNLANGVTGALSFANLTTGTPRSVLGVTGNAISAMASIQGATDQILRVSTTGTALSFGSINLAAVAAVGTSVLGSINGGTGNSAYLDGQILVGRSSDGILVKTSIAVGANGALVYTAGAGTVTLTYKYNHAPFSLTDVSNTLWNVVTSENAIWPINNTNRQLTIQNPEAGRTYNLEIRMVLASATVTTWPTGTTWDNGVVPTLPAVTNAAFLISFYCIQTTPSVIFRAVPSSGAFA